MPLVEDDMLHALDLLEEVEWEGYNYGRWGEDGNYQCPFCEVGAPYFGQEARYDDAPNPTRYEEGIVRHDHDCRWLALMRKAGRR